MLARVRRRESRTPRPICGFGDVARGKIARNAEGAVQSRRVWRAFDQSAARKSRRGHRARGPAAVVSDLDDGPPGDRSGRSGCASVGCGDERQGSPGRAQQRGQGFARGAGRTSGRGGRGGAADRAVIHRPDFRDAGLCLRPVGISRRPVRSDGRGQSAGGGSGGATTARPGGGRLRRRGRKNPGHGSVARRTGAHPGARF